MQAVPSMPMLFSAVSGGAQLGAGIASRKMYQDAADLLKTRGALYGRLGRLAITERQGRVRAAFAKAGVDPTTGSPMDSLAQQALLEEMALASEVFSFRLHGFQLESTGNRALAQGIASGLSEALRGTLISADLGAFNSRGLSRGSSSRGSSISQIRATVPEARTELA
jgi:hypothetical protein